MKQVVPTTGVFPYEPLGFTNAVAVGGMLYLSGISALDSAGMVIGDDIAEQTIHTFENIGRVLQAGGSDLDRIVQMTSFVVDLPHNGQGYVETRQRVLTWSDYTSATIGVAALMVPGLLLEVQCCADIGNSAGS